MIKPKTKSPRKPRLKITNEITNKIQKLRAKDETNKTQTHKRNKKQKKTTKNNKTPALGYPDLDMMMASRGRNMSFYN